jgi:hypothetical protein
MTAVITHLYFLFILIHAVHFTQTNSINLFYFPCFFFCFRFYKTIILILILTIFSLVSGASVVAIPSLGEPDGPVDSDLATLLTCIGDHLLAQELADATRLGTPDRASFLARVPGPVRNLLGKAYSELYLLDDNCLTMAYLNGESPFKYPDQRKRDHAALLLATPQLVELELDRVSQLAAIQAGSAFGLI